jgi:hypothetical protein
MLLKPWQQAVVDCLIELADSSLQRRSWLSRDGTPLAPPGELVCQLFDDTGLDDILESGQEAFSPTCDRILVELGRSVDKADVEQPIESLLEDDGWREVIELAEAALSEIRKFVADRRG